MLSSSSDAPTVKKLHLAGPAHYGQTAGTLPIACTELRRYYHTFPYLSSSSTFWKSLSFAASRSPLTSQVSAAAHSGEVTNFRWLPGGHLRCLIFPCTGLRQPAKLRHTCLRSPSSINLSNTRFVIFTGLNQTAAISSIPRRGRK